jgi:NADH-quinone oxidoreductase subunit L
VPEAIGLVVLFPLLGFLTIALVGSRLSERAAAILACGAIGLAFVSAIVAAIGAGTPKSVFNYDWTVAGSWKVSFGLLADPLSTFMALIVTGVGFLIHVYSIGYMAGEENYRRFFAYLNLFVFAMLVLVTADNFVLLMIGWGGVGLSSFLLIGFYTERISAVQAARKAFVINTIGDVGLLLGVFTILYNTGGAISYADVFTSPNLLGDGVNYSWVNWTAALLFVACAAKSAQLPLHTWLADAMEGPTPVSALIHAATMVTAGVYLVCRAAPIFGRSEVMLVAIPLIGAITAIYAATCALGQFDLKRVLAYSTVSQLGYMFMAAGTGAYQAALFHLMTHAFFKALLFLAAGAVIHGLGGEQDMRKMGALGSKMPLARIVFLIGALAISGIPPFAGFFSKEAILGTFPLLGDSNPGITSGLGAAGQALVGWVGIITALLTAFYMFRLYR